MKWSQYIKIQRETEAIVRYLAAVPQDTYRAIGLRRELAALLHTLPALLDENLTFLYTEGVVFRYSSSGNGVFSEISSTFLREEGVPGRTGGIKRNYPHKLAWTYSDDHTLFANMQFRILPDTVVEDSVFFLGMEAQGARILSPVAVELAQLGPDVTMHRVEGETPLMLSGMQMGVWTLLNPMVKAQE